ncbi:MAG: hypothetical protein WEF86_07725 [Gemmatimonadota bacterium]
MAKNNGSSSSWISASVALVAVGLFMGWLITRQPEDSAIVAEPSDTTQGSAGIETGDATVLAPDAMANSAGLDALSGQRVRLNGLNVIGGLSPQLFWTELSGGDLYLVKLDSAMVAAGTPTPAPGSIDVVGTIRSKDPAVLDAWMESGVLESDDQRMQAEFGLTYLEAQRIQAAGN